MKNKNNTCKKCGFEHFNIFALRDKKRCKYYLSCVNCGKKIRIYPDRIAYHYYYALCRYETALYTKDMHSDKNFSIKYFNQLKKIKKDYKYIYHNLVILYKYILYNNLFEKFKELKNYEIIDEIKGKKDLFNENDCNNILEKLIKIKDKI